jgi:tetratricopeptide (TPR) repeat protein
VSGWKVANIAQIEKRAGGWVPIRDHFGGTAYGINAYVAAEEGADIIGDHTEAQEGHEEIYVVLNGRATFTVAGEEIDAPAGKIVFVRDPSVQRKAVATEAGTTILAVGAKAGAAYEVSAWEAAWAWTSRGMALYAEKKYAEAADVFEEGLGVAPAHFGLHYNLACTRALNGEPDAAFEHLATAIKGYPGFAELARDDADFASIRDDPRFPAQA